MIDILLSTYNGKDFIDQQVNSILNQNYDEYQIIIRDDKSSDETVKILKSYNLKPIDSTANLGAKNSFATLLAYSIKNNSNYFMFCDQDDVWNKDKIKKTVLKMQEMEKLYPNLPILVHTDLTVVDENLRILNNSFWNYEKINPKLNNLNRLLLQNTITGCTMLINRKLAEIALPIPDEAIMHDWWLGLVASKFGKICILEEPTLLYRQHSSNDTGVTKFTIKSIISRFLNTDVEKYSKQAECFLNRYRDKCQDETIQVLEYFINIKDKSFFEKSFFLLKNGILKQGVIRNIGFFLRLK